MRDGSADVMTAVVGALLVPPAGRELLDAVKAPSGAVFAAFLVGLDITSSTASSADN